jgi:hypothetical protein
MGDQSELFEPDRQNRRQGTDNGSLTGSIADDHCCDRPFQTKSSQWGVASGIDGALEISERIWG